MSIRGKNILAIVTTPYYWDRGSSLRVDAVLEKLSKENNVDVVAYPYGKDPKNKQINLYRVGKKRDASGLGVGKISLKKIYFDALVFFKAFSLILKNEYDIVHCEDFEAAFLGAILKVVFRKKKYVYDLHNTIHDNLEIAGAPKLLLNVVDSISKLIVNQYDLVILNWGVYKDLPAKRKFLLYDKFSVEAKKVDLPVKGKYLVYAGNYNKYQGVEGFLRAFAKSRISHKLVLVGKTNESIHSLLDELDISDRVYMTGLLSIEETNYVVKGADFALIPRISGKQPGLKALNHVMLDVVSLATNITANTEVLTNGSNGILYTEKDQLIKILDNIDEKGIDMGKFKKGLKIARDEILKNWEYKYFINNYSKIYER